MIKLNWPGPCPGRDHHLALIGSLRCELCNALATYERIGPHCDICGHFYISSYDEQWHVYNEHTLKAVQG